MAIIMIMTMMMIMMIMMMMMMKIVPQPPLPSQPRCNLHEWEHWSPLSTPGHHADDQHDHDHDHDYDHQSPSSWDISIWRQMTWASPLLKRAARFSWIVATSFSLLQHQLQAGYSCSRRKKGKPPSKSPPSSSYKIHLVKLVTWAQACGPGEDRWQPVLSLRPPSRGQ